MHDNIEVVFAKHSRHRFNITNVSIDQLIVWRSYMLGNIAVLYLWRVKIIKIVNNGNMPPTLGKKPVNKMRPNKSGSAGYENIFHQARILIQKALSRMKTMQDVFEKSFVRERLQVITGLEFIH